MKNLPERIYLNLGDGCFDDVDFRDLSEVTWSKEKVNDTDVEYVRKSQWTSVDERLPEDDRLVLAHFSDVEPNLCYATAYYRKGVWNVPDDWYYDCRIDFWMPIPIPQLNPEKEER